MELIICTIFLNAQNAGKPCPYLLVLVCGKGFSDQSDIPFDIHKSVFDRVKSDVISKYGENALDVAWTIDGSSVLTDIVVYIK